jgi:hypothetical protein
MVAPPAAGDDKLDINPSDDELPQFACVLGLDGGLVASLI